jgi:hypothetical protein
MERLFTAQQVLESWNKSCKAIDDVDQEAKDIVREALELKIAEEQGLILRLPCPIGSTIWFVGNEFVNDYEVRRYIVDETGIDCVQIAKEIDGRDYWNSFSIDDFGKTVFLTKEEAEQALKHMGE